MTMNYFAYPATKGDVIMVPHLLSTQQKKDIADRLIKVICEYYKIDILQLYIKKKRDFEIIRTKHIIIWFIRQYTAMSLKDIGRLFGLDHSSILFAFNKIEGQLTNKFDDSYKKDIEQIKKLL